MKSGTRRIETHESALRFLRYRDGMVRVHRRHARGVLPGNVVRDEGGQQMSILTGHADKEGALVITRRFHNREIPPWEIAGWLEEHLGAEYCLEVIDWLRKRPAVVKAQAEIDADDAEYAENHK